jgi:hypothetical protein
MADEIRFGSNSADRSTNSEGLLLRGWPLESR